MKTKQLLTFALALFSIAPAFAHKYLQQGLSWQNLYENGRYLVPETLHSDTICIIKDFFFVTTPSDYIFILSVATAIICCFSTEQKLETPY